MRIEEKSLILPTLYIIQRNGSVSTTELIKELTNVFNPIGEDAEILLGRKDTKFSQKVRNLKSHRESNNMDEYTEITSDEKYILTDKGNQLLLDNLEEVEYLFSNKFAYEDIITIITDVDIAISKKKKVIIYSEEDMISEGSTTITESVKRKRSKKLRDAAIDYYQDDDGKLFCTVCGFCFEDCYGNTGKGFIEIHHEKPIYQYSSGGFESFIKEAIKNVKPVCSNCHRMIHRNYKNPLSIIELKAFIK